MCAFRTKVKSSTICGEGLPKAIVRVISVVPSKILCAAVKQQQGIVIQRAIGFPGGVIVDNCAVWAAGRNCGKAFGVVIVIFGAETVQFFNNIYFGLPKRFFSSQQRNLTMAAPSRI